MGGGGLAVAPSGELNNVWACPTTLLIAQTLYLNTNANRMRQAQENIEKVRRCSGAARHRCLR